MADEDGKQMVLVLEILAESVPIVMYFTSDCRLCTHH